VERFHAEEDEEGGAWAAIHLGLARFREEEYDAAEGS
jgi:hypothetical protein